MMFSGVFVVFLNAFFGPRRILLPAAAVFTVASVLLPFSPNYWTMIALLVIAGLASGTFYSLTLTFVLTALPKRLIIFGIAAYAADIVFVSNFASMLEGWYVEISPGTGSSGPRRVLTPVMMTCVYFGIPWRPQAGPHPSWRGFAYFSVAPRASVRSARSRREAGLAALRHDRGDVGGGSLSAGGHRGATAVAAESDRGALGFLNRRNTIILAVSIFVFKFGHLATIVLIPSFLGNIQQYRPLDTGRALAWVAVPMFAVVWLVAVLIIHTNSRLILSVGLTATSVAVWVCGHVDSSWAGRNFELVELLLASGFAATYVGLVGSIVLEALESGALASTATIATFSGFMHFIRIFGGQVGVAVLTRFLAVREQFHSNLLGLHVEVGNWLTDDRVRMLTGGVLPGSTGAEEAQARAVGILGQQVRAQAYTLATADAFTLIAWMSVAYLLLMLFLRPGKISYGDLRNMQ